MPSPSPKVPISSEVTDTLYSPSGMIDSPEELRLWLAQEQAAAQAKALAPTRADLASLQSAESLCTDVSEQLSDLEQQLAEVESRYLALEGHTLAVRQACEPLMDKQSHLAELVAALDHVIHMLDGVERASSLLDQPDPLLCHRPEFLPTLAGIDRAIAFLEDHPHYLDAPAYLTRFRQCRRKGAIILRRHVVDAWTSLSNELARRKDPSHLATHHVRFRSMGPELRPLLAALEASAEEEDSYSRELLIDCALQYSRLRLRLVAPVVQAHLASLPQKDIVVFCQRASAYLATVCADERLLFQVFFTLEYTYILRDQVLVPLLQQLAQAVHPHLSILSPEEAAFNDSLSAVRASLSEEPAASIALGDQVTLGRIPLAETGPSSSSSADPAAACIVQ